MRKKTFYKYICENMNGHEKKLNKDLLSQCWLDFRQWPHANTYSDGIKAICFFLCDTIHNNHILLQNMHEEHQQFVNEYNQAIVLKQQHYCILNYCKDLGANTRQLAEDKRAFSRYFDRDAVEDRFQKIVGTKELQVYFVCDRLAALSKNFLHDEQNLVKIEKACTLFLNYTSNARLATKAFVSLLKSALHVENPQKALTPQTMHFLYRSALDRNIDLWTQCTAIEFLPHLSDETTVRNTFLKRLQHVHEGDDFFVRRKVVETLATCHLNNKLRFMELIAKDPSPSVRQKSCAVIVDLPYEEQQLYWERFILEESDSAVQGSTVIALGKSVVCEKTLHRAIGIMGKVFQGENNDFVVRTTMKVMCDTMTRLKDNSRDLASSWAKHCRNLLYEYKKSASTHIKRWCSSTLEYLWCLAEDDTFQLYLYLRQRLHKISPQKSKLLWRSIFRSHDKVAVARVLAVLTQDDYNYDIHWGWPFVRITRGHVFKLRWWRVLHELRNPAPDKRVTTRHTVARSCSASFRVPSTINAEMSETKVPGEPLFIEEEQGWRPYLPLLDDILSANNCLWYRPTSIYTNEGVTLIKPPRFLFLRMWAYIRVTWGFRKYAALRNWRENMQSAANSYLMSLYRLGFRFEFHDYPNKDIPIEPDKDILRFFPCILFFDATFWKYMEVLWDKFQLYFFSAYSNNVQHLAIFITLISVYFLGKHIWQNRVLAKARNAIPLVIGGWGTRGKSGTERLKAALVNSLGYSLVSKTTGCEAMFLYCYPFAKTEEIFLFRPYDKATIWEQYNLVRLAASLDTDVFLWECMALNPAYVKILQADWMRDDLSTITNTYPDHEDIQGPAGKDVAETIAVFTPEKSKVIVSEEQMLPLLREQAQRKKTQFDNVNWLDAGLIPEDVLQRFPYKEHPYNIALVLKIAEELKIPYDYAIKEMADRIVADIGVLKTYPAAVVNKRQLEFSNGMSANERLGALGNWKRLQLDKQNIYEQPHIWVSSVVNNRADRIPRSKVFARILVRDIEADRHFLIGNNLDGLISYIDDEWEEYIATVYICSADGKLKNDALQILENAAKRLRVAYKKEHVQQRLQVMVDEKIAHLWPNPQQLQEKLKQTYENYEEIWDFHQQNTVTLQEYEVLQQKIAKNAADSKLQAEFRKQLYKWFKRKIVVVENYHATGDQVINTIVKNTPPNVYNKIIGLQNIKGTGLDFVYRWQAWQICYDMCLKICSENASVQSEGIQELTTFIEHGILTCEHALSTIKEAITNSSDSKQKSKLHMIEKSIEEFKKRNEKEISGAVVEKTSRFPFLLKLAEQILDAGDAIKRRKKANRIYADLKNQRISIKRAIYELKKINKRQKGGWLADK